MLLTAKGQKYKNILKMFYLLIVHTQFAYNLVLGIYIKHIYTYACMYTWVYLNRPGTERRAMFLILRGSESCSQAK